MCEASSTQVTRREQRACPCGCGQQYPLLMGVLRYGESSEALFVAALMHGKSEAPHLWTLLGTGPWFDNDTRGCWVTLHSWLADGNINSRVEDPSLSPFSDEDACDERRLLRDEVLGQKGAPEWAFERRQQLVAELPVVASHFGAVDA